MMESLKHESSFFLFRSPHWLAQFSVGTWLPRTFGIQDALRRPSVFYFFRFPHSLFHHECLGRFSQGEVNFFMCVSVLLDHAQPAEPSLFIAFLVLGCLTWATLFAIFLSRELSHFSHSQSASALNMIMHSPPDCASQSLLLPACCHFMALLLSLCI
jgi:hypothetical protein